MRRYMTTRIKYTITSATITAKSTKNQGDDNSDYPCSQLASRSLLDTDSAATSGTVAMTSSA